MFLAHLRKGEKVVINAIDRFNQGLGKVAAYCALIMLLAQAFSVIARYVFSYGIISVQESVVYGHSILFLFGSALVLQINNHVRVDVFYGRYSSKTRRIMDIVSLLVFVLPVCALIGWVSWPYVARAWSTLEGSRQGGGLPAVFLLKTAILVFAFSVGAQALSTTVKLLRGEEWRAGGDQDGLS